MSYLEDEYEDYYYPGDPEPELEPVLDVALGKVTFSGPDYIIIEDSLKGPMTLKIDPAKVKVKAGEIYSVKFDAYNLQVIELEASRE